MIVTIGLFLAINSIAQVQFGNDIKVAAARVPDKTWRPGQRADLGRHARARRRARRSSAALLYLLLNRTKVGLAFRAVASNPESSRLVGVPVGRC